MLFRSATTTSEGDDFITRMAVGDAMIPNADPTAFTDATDAIANYRGRGQIVGAIDVSPSIAPHAVQAEGVINAADIYPAIVDSPFTLREAALKNGVSEELYDRVVVPINMTHPDGAKPKGRKAPAKRAKKKS